MITFGPSLTLLWPMALLLLPLPFLARLLPARRIHVEVMALPEGIAAHARPAPPPRQAGDGLLLWLIWALVCVGLSQPERLELVPDTSASGRDILITLDMSGSMATEDFSLDGQTITRLSAVKKVAKGFIAARPGDRFGLIIFADRAYVAAPLSYDLTAVTRALDEAEIGLTGRSTAISEGLGLALKRSLNEASENKVIILLSDGRDTAARLDATDVARLAAAENIRIHTIALGPEDLETRPAARDAVDVATLRRIAESAGGESFRVRSMADLEAMAVALDQIEPNPQARPPVAKARPLWIWPAGLAATLLVLLAWRRR